MKLDYTPATPPWRINSWDSDLLGSSHVFEKRCKPLLRSELSLTRKYVQIFLSGWTHSVSQISICLLKEVKEQCTILPWDGTSDNLFLLVCEVLLHWGRSNPWDHSHNYIRYSYVQKRLGLFFSRWKNLLHFHVFLFAWLAGWLIAWGFGGFLIFFFCLFFSVFISFPAKWKWVWTFQYASFKINLKQISQMIWTSHLYLLEQPSP